MKLISLLFPAILIGLFVNCKSKNTLTAHKDKCSAYYDTILHKNIFTYVDSMPQYPRGISNLYSTISTNYKIPVEEYFQGYVLVSFIIDERGQLTHKKVYKDNKNTVVSDDQLSPAEKEVLRILDNTDTWKPGKCQGKCVPVLYYLPIKF